MAGQRRCRAEPVAWRPWPGSPISLPPGGRSRSSSSRPRSTPLSSPSATPSPSSKPLRAQLLSRHLRRRRLHPRSARTRSSRGSPGDRRSRRWPTSPARATRGPRSPRSWPSTGRPASRTSSPWAVMRRPTRPTRAPSDYTYAVRPAGGRRRRGTLLDRRRRPPRGAPPLARPGQRPPAPRGQARPGRLRHHPVLLRGRRTTCGSSTSSTRSAAPSRSCPGIMPVTNLSQVQRMAELVRRRLPDWLADRLEPRPTTPTRCARWASTAATELCADLLDAGRARPALLHAEPLHRDPRDLRQPRPARRRDARSRRYGATHARVRKLYIDGAWVPSDGTGTHRGHQRHHRRGDGHDPRGDAADVDRAVAGRQAAFPDWAPTSARSGPSTSAHRRGPDGRASTRSPTVIAQRGRHAAQAARA